MLSDKERYGVSHFSEYSCLQINRCVFWTIWLNMSSLFGCRTNTRSYTCWRMFATRFAKLSNAFLLPWFSDEFGFLFLSFTSYLSVFNKNSIQLFLFFFIKIFLQQRLFKECEFECSTWTSLTFVLHYCLSPAL